MENCVRELYDERELPRLKAKLVIQRAAAVLIGLAVIGLCVWSLLETDRHYPAPGLIRTIAISTLGGWLIITLRLLVIKRTGYAYAHVKAILEGRREAVEGAFTLTGHRLLLEKGVNMRTVTVTGAERTDTLRLWDGKAKLFDDKNAVKVYAVYGFIAAYEIGE